MSKRRKHYEHIHILDLEYRGYGIAKPQGKVLFVEDSLPGEEVDARIIKDKRDYAFATPTAVHSYSPERIEPFCRHFHACGGCKWQYLPYERQLEYKQYFVEQIMQRIGKMPDPDIDPIMGCDEDRYYRNKLDFSFAASRWLSREEIASGEDFDRRGLGFHVRRRFDRVLDITHCWLQPEPSNTIRNALRDFAVQEDLSFYNPVTHEGFLRSLIIRTSLFGETMVMLVFAEPDEAPRRRVLEFLSQWLVEDDAEAPPTQGEPGGPPRIHSIAYMINESKNDATAPHTAHIYAGRDHIRERMGERVLKIHPKSFYQTNPKQAVRLYGVARQMAELTGTETLYDLYCGIGSIGLFLSDRAGRVVGIDNVPEAVANARENARANGATNCRFVDGDVKDLLDADFVAEHGRPDVIVLDPPRAGVHPKVLETLLRVAPRQIVYVSCNPATQARDLLELTSAYEIRRTQPVDMFPQTYHIENVVDLVLKSH
jgi:23S rRNA (uracil1939-C5)-methyltransferase